ncbi:hypothetical protein KJA15_03505 [Patescibacteria group bacterium]|nr:hypothetical protein [Patescibacteria group bacterium]
MKIAICVSLDFTNQIRDIANNLTEQGHEVILPQTVEMILNGEVAFEQIMKEKENGEISKRAIKQNSLKYYFERIKGVDAILVLNFEKNGIRGYIGGNVFLEMGFAYVFGKKIFLLNEIPDMLYEDEIKAMQPIILNGDLAKIR